MGSHKTNHQVVPFRFKFIDCSNSNASGRLFVSSTPPTGPFLVSIANSLSFCAFPRYQIRGADNTTLSDICFKPLYPANNFCTIQSVMNYFQNDPLNLDLTETDGLGYNITYLSHLDVCFR